MSGVLHGWGRVLFALIAGLFLGAWRVSWQNQDLALLAEQYNQIVTLSGTVSTPPEVKEKDLRITIEAISFNYSTLRLKSQVYVMLPASNKTGINRSDHIILYGKLQPGFGNYGGFLYRPQLISVQSPRPPDFAWQIRSFLSERVQQVLNREQSSLALGYLFGDKSLLSESLDTEIKIVGLSHLIVTSGFHLGIIVSLARKLFGKISRQLAVVGSIALILAFTAITGFSASMSRAGLVASLSLIAWLVGRKFHPARLIIYSAAITVALRPEYLTNIGFLLSFAAYSGIIFIMPLLEKFFYGPSPTSKIATAIFPTIAAQALCLPISIYYFGRIPIVGALAGIIVSPTIALVMALTLCTSVLPFCAVFTQILVDFHLNVIHFFASIPWGSVEVEAGHPQIFLVYLPILAILIYLFWRTGHRYRPRLALDNSQKYGKIYPC